MTAQSDIPSVTLQWLRETHKDLDARLEEPAFKNALAVVTQASRFLTRLLIGEPEAIDVLSNLEDRPQITVETEEDLSRWKRLEILRIAARDLTDIDPLETVAENLASLADDVLRRSAELAGADDLVIVGMGKLGGRELNYSSDIDVMFVGSTKEATVREVMRIARLCFRVDANLRPEGRSGALIRSVESYEQYWDKSASAWEFQALMKARVVCGPSEIADAWERAAHNRVWGRPFGPEEIREAREMKARTEDLVARDGNDEREVKRGRGGIRDIEFAVQLLQLVHGATDETVRSPTTLTALQQLARGGYIAAEDAEGLSDSYCFLRMVEHHLQLVDDQQTHLVPTDRNEREELAISLGYRGPLALDDFDHNLRFHQARVRKAHEKLYFRPLLEAFAIGRVDAHSPLATQLAAFGFTDAERTRIAVDELTRGLARSSNLMQQLMPLLLDWLSASPDPDEGLLGLRTLISGFRTPASIVNVFRDSPESARRLCLLLGTSRMFSQSFHRHPEFIKELSLDSELIPSTPPIERLRRALTWRTDKTERLQALSRLTDAEKLRLAACDVLELCDSRRLAQMRSQLADAVVTIALETLNPRVPVALIGMGRFGGGEMSYASDVDLIVIHGGKTIEEQQLADAFAQDFLTSISNANPAKHIYDVDYDLRPEGKNGVLARSIDGCVDYYKNWAQTWERQALVRARPIAGDPEVIDRFNSIVDEFVWSSPPSNDQVREIRKLKARMENERIPRNEDPNFHLKLGPGSLSDIEWTVQLLQLQHSIRGGNTLKTLDELVGRDVVDENDYIALRDAWTFCDDVRNRIFLVNNGTSNALPTSRNTLTALSRSLHQRDIKEIYKKSTRRSRAVVERLFYGQTT